jgi:hypothetical protein
MVGGMRRSLLALGVSLAVHVAIVAAMVGSSAWRIVSLAPKIQVQAIAFDVVKDLPLGAPPARKVDKSPKPRAHVRRPRHRTAIAHEGVVVSAPPDAGPRHPEIDAGEGRKHDALDGGGSIDGGRRRPGDLRESGPEGSRVVALLRLDRLRASPDSEHTIAALDQLLTLLPDRRRLIEGTGFDLYRDFDDLLIATPNPRDPAVTFLAARHHLGDAALKAGLDRGAKAAHKPIWWRTIDGRPVGIRQQSRHADPNLPSLDRDDRILVLPGANLAIMATAAYAAQLLGTDPSARKTSKPLPIDGGAIDAGPLIPKPTHVPWPDIVARIDAEDAALPDDAVFMMTATNLFEPAGAPPGAVPPRDAGTPAQAAPDTQRIPDLVTLVVGVEAPYLDVIAEFKTAADAESWEQEAPAWRRRLLTNPIVLISGFSPLVRRAEISREDSTLELRADATVDEIQRLLNLVVNLTRSALAVPRPTNR